MAAKKWPKWLIGLSGVVSFTGFLYLSQSRGDTGILADTENPPAENLLSANADTGNLPTWSIAPKKQPSVSLFIHSRADFQQIADLPPEAKSEREKQIEELDWNAAPKGMTVMLPASKTTETAPVPTPTPAPKANVNPVPTSTATPKPTVNPAPISTPAPKPTVNPMPVSTPAPSSAHPASQNTASVSGQTTGQAQTKSDRRTKRS